jgi:hypothetical protein
MHPHHQLRTAAFSCIALCVHCRSRLSSDQFGLFLQVIKDLNTGRQTRDHTLKRAREIFGISNADLYGKHPCGVRLEAPTCSNTVHHVAGAS